MVKSMASSNKAILLSGPKNSGKDETIKFLVSKGLPLIKRETKEALYETLFVYFQISPEDFFSIYDDRDQKEVPRGEFLVTTDTFKKLSLITGAKLTQDRILGDKVMISSRESMITVSEIVVKPVLGLDWFGVQRAKRIGRGEISIDGSASAFNVNGEIRTDEVYPLFGRVDEDNVLLIRIYGRSSFEGDSRNYIPDGIVKNTIDVWNDKSEQEFLDKMYDIVSEFIEEK